MFCLLLHRPPFCSIPGSSFCYLNTGTSGRHGYLLPCGVSSEPSVRYSNLISCRTAALVEIALILSQDILVEQPDHRRGLMGMPRWQCILQKYSIWRSRCKQGAYGGLRPKPTAVFSQHSKFGNLETVLSLEDKERVASHVLVSKKRDHLGNIRVNGRPEELRATQAYPLNFARVLVEKWTSACDP